MLAGVPDKPKNLVKEQPDQDEHRNRDAQYPEECISHISPFDYWPPAVLYRFSQAGAVRLRATVHGSKRYHALAWPPLAIAMLIYRANGPAGFAVPCHRLGCDQGYVMQLAALFP